MTDNPAAQFAHPFYFLRHGETEWNRDRRTQGQTDTTLTANGVRQAEAAGAAFRSTPIKRIVASPLSRVRITADAVAKHHDVPVTYDDALMECHLGDLQGQPHGPWLTDYWTGDFDPPNGETFLDFATRVWHAMARAVALGPDTLIVAHGGLWIAARHFVTIEPNLMPMPNAMPLQVFPNADGWTWQQVGTPDEDAA